MFENKTKSKKKGLVIGVIAALVVVVGALLMFTPAGEFLQGYTRGQAVVFKLADLPPVSEWVSPNPNGKDKVLIPADAATLKDAVKLAKPNGNIIITESGNYEGVFLKGDLNFNIAPNLQFGSVKITTPFYADGAGTARGLWFEGIYLKTAAYLAGSYNLEDCAFTKINIDKKYLQYAVVTNNAAGNHLYNLLIDADEAPNGIISYKNNVKIGFTTTTGNIYTAAFNIKGADNKLFANLISIQNGQNFVLGKKTDLIANAYDQYETFYDPKKTSKIQCEAKFIGTQRNVADFKLGASSTCVKDKASLNLSPTNLALLNSVSTDLYGNPRTGNEVSIGASVAQ